MLKNDLIIEQFEDSVELDYIISLYFAVYFRSYAFMLD